MADNNKPMPAGPVEGDVFLFVKLNPKTSEFHCIFSNVFDALALLSMAETHMDNLKRQAMAPPPAVSMPNLSLPSFESMRRRQS